MNTNHGKSRAKFRDIVHIEYTSTDENCRIYYFHNDSNVVTKLFRESEFLMALTVHHYLWPLKTEKRFLCIVRNFMQLQRSFLPLLVLANDPEIMIIWEVRLVITVKRIRSIIYKKEDNPWNHLNVQGDHVDNSSVVRRRGWPSSLAAQGQATPSTLVAVKTEFLSVLPFFTHCFILASFTHCLLYSDLFYRGQMNRSTFQIQCMSMPPSGYTERTIIWVCSC
jgi:hypothetical protein